MVPRRGMKNNEQKQDRWAEQAGGPKLNTPTRVGRNTEHSPHDNGKGPGGGKKPFNGDKTGTGWDEDAADDGTGAPSGGVGPVPPGMIGPALKGLGKVGQGASTNNAGVDSAGLATASTLAFAGISGGAGATA